MEIVGGALHVLRKINKNTGFHLAAYFWIFMEPTENSYNQSFSPSSIHGKVCVCVCVCVYVVCVTVRAMNTLTSQVSDTMKLKLWNLHHRNSLIRDEDRWHHLSTWLVCIIQLFKSYKVSKWVFSATEEAKKEAVSPQFFLKENLCSWVKLHSNVTCGSGVAVPSWRRVGAAGLESWKDDRIKTCGRVNFTASQ